MEHSTKFEMKKIFGDNEQKALFKNIDALYQDQMSTLLLIEQRQQFIEKAVGEYFLY